MSIPEWLYFVKDKFKDAAAYGMVTEQVSLLEERIRLREDINTQLVGKVADLESQLVAIRSDLAAKSDEASQLEKKLAKYNRREKFDVISGLAFKRGKRKGEHEQDPRCPNCLAYLSYNHLHSHTDYFCSSCNFKLENMPQPKRVLEKDE